MTKGETLFLLSISNFNFKKIKNIALSRTNKNNFNFCACWFKKTTCDRILIYNEHWSFFVTIWNIKLLGGTQFQFALYILGRRARNKKKFSCLLTKDGKSNFILSFLIDFKNLIKNFKKNTVLSVMKNKNNFCACWFKRTFMAAILTYNKYWSFFITIWNIKLSVSFCTIT